MGKPTLNEQAIEKYREKFEAGDEAALLEALDFCARTGRLPLWLATAYVQRYEDWATFRAPTLDAAFKVSRRGLKISHQARRKRLILPALVGVERLLRAGKPLAAAFDEVGERFGIAAKTVEQIYYDPANRGFRLLLRTAESVDLLLNLEDT